MCCVPSTRYASRIRVCCHFQFPSSIHGVRGLRVSRGRDQFCNFRLRARSRSHGCNGACAGGNADRPKTRSTQSEKGLANRPSAQKAYEAEALIAPKLVQPAIQSEKGLANRPSAQKADEEGANASRKAGSIKPTCRERLGEVRDCTPVRVVRMRPPRAVNERPLIAAVPIGHRDDPAMLPASPQTGVGPLPTDPPEEPKATPPPTQLSVAKEIAPDAAPAAEPTPPVSIPTVSFKKKPRPRVHHASHRRNQYSYASSYSARISRYNVSKTYVQAGYARLW